MSNSGMKYPKIFPSTREYLSGLQGSMNNRCDAILDKIMPKIEGIFRTIIKR